MLYVYKFIILDFKVFIKKLFVSLHQLRIVVGKIFYKSLDCRNRYVTIIGPISKGLDKSIKVRLVKPSLHETGLLDPMEWICEVVFYLYRRRLFFHYFTANIYYSLSF